MNRCFGIVLVCLAASIAAAGQNASSSPGKNSNQQLVARGKYLVENVGTCQDCHTQRNQQGEYVREKWLQGSPLFFKPTVPIPGWAEKSPNIAGLPGWTDEQAIKFFMTGLAYNGLPAGPPMPQYRFNRADATAIVAYLRSLKAAPGATLKSANSPQREKKPAPKKAKVME